MQWQGIALGGVLGGLVTALVVPLLTAQGVQAECAQGVVAALLKLFGL